MRRDEATATAPLSASGTGLLHRFRRPDNPLERTRWLFLLLVIASVAVLLPQVAAGAPASGVIAVLAAVGLTLSCCRGYLAGGSGWIADVVDAACICAYTMAATKPDQALGLAFAAIWLRSTFSSRWRNLARCLLYEVAMTVGLVCWPALPGHSGSSEAATLLAVYPVLAVTVTIVSFMTSNVVHLAQAADRESALARLGSGLLGETRTDEILALAWRTAGELCAATPGLRIVVIKGDGDDPSVNGLQGSFAETPTTSVLRRAAEQAATDGRPFLDDALDAAAGETCAWMGLPLPQGNGREFLVAGAPAATLETVRNSLRSMVNQVALAIRSAEARDQLVVRAMTDTLTGLANRASFADAASRALSRPATGGVALLFIDLDDFKHVNDGLGHAAGDALLRAVSERLSAATRGDDVCARLGGDEFAVLLTGVGVDAARQTAERLVDILCQPVVIDGQLAYVAASIGVVHTLAPDARYEELVQHADVAMYAAKAQGKRRVQVYSAGLLDAGDEAVFSRQLAAAAGRGELEVHYQPVVDLVDGTCTAVEALVRWRHPQRGLLAPGAFIAEAERTGAIREIGAWVLGQACADVAQWRRAGYRFALHVNVSVAQLIDDSFPAAVRGCLDRSGLAAGDLVLEITESMVLDAPSALERLRVLAGLGIRIAVDDFGTGYAALTLLRHLPASIVKIDRSFVAGAADNPADLAAIEAILQIARRLGLETIAEGVEDIGQHGTLVGAGAKAAQGFMYARPAPASALTDWLAARAASGTTALVPGPAPASVLAGG